MRKLVGTLVASLVLAWPQLSLALELPAAPTGRINDYAGALDGPARARLEAQLQSYEQGTTRQIAVAIFKSLEGESLEDFTVRLAQKWKIGGKAQSDGVLLAVFVQEHKLRIEVGYGLEDKLTDLQSSRIIREEIAPRLRAGKFEEGLGAGLAAIDTAITGRDHAKDMPAPLATAAPRGTSSLGWPIILFGIFLVLVFALGGGRFLFGMLLGGWLGGSSGWSSRSGGSSLGGGGGGFSGGGRSFGGGGASGSW